jgi:predicted enzyme related to lactoylglutathione lyase
MDAFKTHGAFSWSELMTPDPSAAADFYGKLFGWTFDTMNMGQGPYHVVKVGDAAVGGIAAPMGAAPAGMPATWGVYMTVERIDDTLAQCQSLGGRLLSGPFEVPGVGRMEVLQDQQGAIFNAMTYSMPGG